MRLSVMLYNKLRCSPRSNRIHGESVSRAAHSVCASSVHCTNASSAVRLARPPLAITRVGGNSVRSDSGSVGGGGAPGGVSTSCRMVSESKAH